MSYLGRGLEQVDNISKLDNITFNGGTTYALTKDSAAFTPISSNALLVSIDGVIQQGNFSVSGTNIVFNFSPTGSNTCDFIMHYGTGLITTPADDTVAAASIKTDAVTTAKIQNDAVTVDKLNLISTGSVPSLEAKGTSGVTEGYIQLNCAENSHGIKLKSPPHSAGASYTLTFPNNDGNANQFLQTDGNGVLSFASISGTLGNFSATEFTTITFSSVAGNSNSTQDFTSNLAVGFYLVEINTRGYATSDTNGIQVTANPTLLHSGITMYALSPNSSGGGQGTRTTLASRREFWNVTNSSNSFRSSHGNISMWSSAHQTLPNLQGKIRALRIA